MAAKPAQTAAAQRSPFSPQWALLLLAALCLAGGFWWLQTQRPPTTVQVQATSPIAAYTIVDASAVTTTVGLAARGALTDLSAAAGRLALAAIQPGTVITSGMLLPAPAPPAGWLSMRLPLTDTLTFAPGETVILYGAAPGEAAARELTRQALVIAASGDSLTVAAPPAVVPAALGYAANGRLFAVRRVR